MELQISWKKLSKALVVTAGLAAIIAPVGAGPGGGNGKGGGGGGSGDGGGGTPGDPEIAYIEDGAVWVMDADGGAKAAIFAGGWAHWVSWSPDGTRLVLAAEVGGLPGIWTIGADGSDLRLVTVLHWSSMAYDAQWSPAPTADGHEKILFIELTSEGAEGTFDVFAINPDGTGRVHLVDTPLPFMEVGCTWSPDASRIAVIEDQFDTLTVYDLGLLDGALAVVGSSQVPSTPPDISDVDWARTQNKVAVASFVQGSSDNNELWVIDLDDSTNRLQITLFEHQDRSPTWSPDDAFLAFRRYPRPGKEIGVRKLSLDGKTDVSLGAKYGSRPDWRR